MLPKRYRLTAEKDFARIFKKGRPAHGRLLVVKTVSTGLDHPRVGFVVSGKVAKKAVDRNRAKRRMRSIVGKVLDEVRPGVDIVLIAKKEMIGASFDDVRESVLRALEKSGVLKAPTT